MPSTGPEAKGRLDPAATAARTVVRPVAKRLMADNDASADVHPYDLDRSPRLANKR